MLIDSMKLAYMTFQSCRHLQPNTDTALNFLIVILEKVKENGVLELDIPIHKMMSLPPDFLEKISYHSGKERLNSLDTLSESSKELFNSCDVATKELQRLWLTESKGAVRSLGYAMHIVPSLVASGKDLKPELYQFNFKVAVYYWGQLSEDMRQTLAAMAGLKLEQANKFAEADNYGIDIFGER